MWETRSESAHGHCLVGFVFKRASHGIRCSSAGGYQTVLHYGVCPLLDWGWLACICRKASCTEPRGPYCVGLVGMNTCTVPPLKCTFPFIGYQLCDNSVGVLFNDSTRLVMYADGDSLQYIDRNTAESYLSVRSYPSALSKKVCMHRK